MSTRVEELKDYVKLLMEVADNQSMDLSMEIGEAVKELHKEMGFKKEKLNLNYYKGGIVSSPFTINTEPPDIKPWITSIKLSNSDVMNVTPIDFSKLNDYHDGLNLLKKDDEDIEGSIF